MSTPRKPRRMFVHSESLPGEYFLCSHYRDKRTDHPVLVIDLSKESVERLKEEISIAIRECENKMFACATPWAKASAALSSLGIKSAKGKAGK